MIIEEIEFIVVITIKGTYLPTAHRYMGGLKLQRSMGTDIQ